MLVVLYWSDPHLHMDVNSWAGGQAREMGVRHLFLHRQPAVIESQKENPSDIGAQSCDGPSHFTRGAAANVSPETGPIKCVVSLERSLRFRGPAPFAGQNYQA